MKTVCLLGSPRPKGNSTIIAKRYCDAAEGFGSDVQIFNLNKLTCRGCQACMACKTKLDKCVLKDDLTEILEVVRDADVLVMATPTYYGDVSSQLKAFMDRTYSYLGPDYHTNPKPARLSPGKTLVFIQTQGDPREKAFSEVFPRYKSFFKWYGFGEIYPIRACGMDDAGEVEAHEDVLKLAEETAKKLTGS
jgi:multimeric flavodoxin WrbA